MKILVLSAYDAMSHQYWHQRLRTDLEQLYDAEVIIVSLPARHFSWRFRGNSLSFAFDARLEQSFDLVVATSMTDLSALRGMAPRLSHVASIVYFHENQFAYPNNSRGQLERQLTSIYSAIAADRLVFNSNFNQVTFLQGADALLKKMPDGVPEGVVNALQQKSQVISVPIDPGDRTKPTNSTPIEVLWNHRWEFDKGLDELLNLVRLLDNFDMKFHLVGQKFRQIPTQISEIQETLGSRLQTFGYIEDRAIYRSLLAKADIVLSTARQEFQGIAVLEAMASGCRPIVPDSLAYQEFVPRVCRYQSLQEAASQLINYSPLTSEVGLPDSVQPLYVKNAWRALVDELVQ